MSELKEGCYLLAVSLERGRIVGVVKVISGASGGLFNDEEL